LNLRFYFIKTPLAASKSRAQLHNNLAHPRPEAQQGGTTSEVVGVWGSALFYRC
jgi:hypothetical protein